ncbi:MAG TPA: dimethylmenaquinone methyltransferase [Actinomycetospora sp.]|jgi:regulator of RNase E activity RraA|uniref:RraA family protein n=1 Tax=Actinomycetospora sp. TaxID=1872135 RepID=UPI002F3ED663
MSKSHPQQWAIVTDDHRPDPAAVAAIAALPTTQLADCGGPVAVVGPEIARVAGGGEFCGPALTVWTKPGDILYVLKAPDLARPGDVLVVDGGGRTDAAVLGDIVSGVLSRAGVVGTLVDGAIRDVDGIDEVGTPTFARGAHPATGSNDGPGAINVTVQVGGVLVRPGDVVRGDASGVVVVSREHLDEVAALARAVDERETAWLETIRGGATLAAALGIDDVIARKRQDAGAELP